MKAGGCKGFSLRGEGIDPAACAALPPHSENILNLQKRMPKCSTTPCYYGAFPTRISNASIADT